MNSDQVSVTLIGPGYGESIVVHLGGGNWMVVDSCVHRSGNLSAPLRYLKEQGVDVESDVKLVVASHWHDDHVAGLAQLLDACKSARFCCASSLRTPEFIAAVQRFEQNKMMRQSSGVREIAQIFEILFRRGTPFIPAISNSRILSLRPDETGHGRIADVWALTPSPRQYEKFLHELSSIMPLLGETKYRAPNSKPNHVSVAILIDFGETSVLLGSDLEENGDPSIGWSFVVSSRERPRTPAKIFKVPHHGSKNGHLDAVWTTMLDSKPIATLTPWNRGYKLPSRDDVERIHAFTPTAFATSKLRRREVRPQNNTVQKTLREMGVKLFEPEPEIGMVQATNSGSDGFSTWAVHLSKEACLLTEVNS